MEKEVFNGFVKVGLSTDVMSRFMYAVLITKSKITSVHHLGLEKYTRQQNSYNNVDLVVVIEKDKVELFETLAKIKLKTGTQFQGNMKVN